MAGAKAGRSGSRWRKLCANLRMQRNPCWICSQAIDYSLAWPDPASFSVDHVKPRSQYPEGREDPANLRASHLSCNSSKQDNEVKPSLGNTSRPW